MRGFLREKCTKVLGCASMMIKTNRYLTERKELDNMFIIIYDFSMAVLMFLFGIYFYKSKGKAARFLSGYNMKSEEERKKYDENAMCKAYGKRMMVMSLPFIVGIIIVFNIKEPVA